MASQRSSQISRRLFSEPIRAITSWMPTSSDILSRPPATILLDKHKTTLAVFPASALPPFLNMPRANIQTQKTDQNPCNALGQSCDKYPAVNARPCSGPAHLSSPSMHSSPHHLTLQSLWSPSTPWNAQDPSILRRRSTPPCPLPRSERTHSAPSLQSTRTPRNLQAQAPMPQGLTARTKLLQSLHLLLCSTCHSL